MKIWCLKKKNQKADFHGDFKTFEHFFHLRTFSHMQKKRKEVLLNKGISLEKGSSNKQTHVLPRQIIGYTKAPFSFSLSWHIIVKSNSKVIEK